LKITIDYILLLLTLKLSGMSVFTNQTSDSSVCS